MRGEVLEREGGKRPVCVRNISPQYIRQLPWNHKKKEALAELRQALAEMEDSPQTEILREKLNIIFPAPLEGGYSSSVSNGSEEISNGMRRSRRTALTNRLTATEAFRPTDAQNASNCRLTSSSIRALSVV